MPGRVYWALHGHRWVKAKAQRVVHRLNVNTLAEEDAAQLEPNAIGVVEFALQEAIPTAVFHRSRALGSLILVDTASNNDDSLGSLLDTPRDSLLSADGKYLYVISDGVHWDDSSKATLSIFARDADGHLSLVQSIKADSAALTGAEKVLISADQQLSLIHI